MSWIVIELWIKLWICCNDVVGMTDEVGRKRVGRESVAHSSARAERAKNRVIPSTRTRKRSKLKEVSCNTSTHLYYLLSLK
jgi:hypothetical protein